MADDPKKESPQIEEKLAVLAPIMKSVQIALDDYNDLFSDFDQSEYSTRVLSDDFLKEMKKRYYENKKGDYELKFTLPAAKRDVKTEHIIKKRLKDYFKAEAEYLDDKIEKIKRDGAYRVGIGFLLLSSDVFLSISYSSDLYVKILAVLLVPAGWYGFYSGFEHLFEGSREFESLKYFNEKCHKTKYEFVSEEDLLRSGESRATGQEQKTEKQSL